MVIHGGCCSTREKGAGSYWKWIVCNPGTVVLIKGYFLCVNSFSVKTTKMDQDLSLSLSYS